ncbi:DUF2922 domain-containing protein [Staphylococcus hyicus]|uniref:DUF2922 domain-containing protein n=2 Tax=Staphylococcus hyicus TaxID=1284 RepID=A0ACD5FKE4_STAHY|nr:DUF2922 domain-containing protein [Staphylococcus hyicus]AJC96847.1 hypothetical protein SHYC_10595 [Staphylococcus hyicus]MCE5153618.1 DUF2922 domain-containing protein [Staphylococcus hyicus]MCO4329063.1 DUF2922 domain-containing protein [Staphylococcus hyicus]MCO4331636.1 DUF2922 domain-containing protein [Staphylococcus hyicus]MCO4334845.1 DUF2922 domain-containing protein [Staphylococcus hyicus]
MNTKTLEITFENTLQKPVKLQLPKLATSITRELVEIQADKIVKLNILNVNGTPISKVTSAQVIDRNITVLF